jgi:TonB family protein
MNLLLDSILKTSVILAVALGALALMRGRSASLRHWVLSVAIACALAAPALSLVLPAWGINAAALLLPAGDGSTVRPVAPAEPRGGAVTVETELVTPATMPAGRLIGVVRLAGSVWLAGMVVSLLLLGLGIARLMRLARAATTIDEGAAPSMASEISETWGLERPVTLLLTEHSGLLVTWGVFRPKVLLPATSQNWSDQRLRVVISHELAHILRGDWTVQIAAELLRAIYWFNPLVWIACRRLRLESEHACDDAVLSGGVAGPDYAQHLVEIARLLNARRRALLPDLPAPAMARPSSLEGRVTAMLNARLDRTPASRRARTLTVAVLLSLTLPLAGLAQATYYSLSGSVVDPTNRVLPGATLVLSNTERQSRHEVKSDATGKFEFVGLPRGQYTFETSLPGFATFKEDLRVTGNIRRNLQLEVGSLQETITVSDATAAPPPSAEVVALKALEARTRYLEFEKRGKAACAGGVAGPVGGNIMAPRKLVDKRPVYPEHLQEAKVGGTVTMEALIGTDGTVKEVKDVKGPHPDLEAAAAEAVRQWAFSQTMLNCEPIEVRMHVTTNFKSEP